MFALATRRPGLFLFNVVLWGLFHALPLGVGLVLKAAFDALASAEEPLASIWTPLAFLIALYAVRLTVFRVGVHIWTDLYYYLKVLLQANVVGWLVAGPGAQRLAGAPGEAVGRLRDDVDTVVEYIENWVDIGGEVLFAMVALGIMAAIDARLTAVLVVPLACFVLLVSRLGDRIEAYRRASRDAATEVSGFLGELFTAVQTVKVAGAEERTVAHLQRIGERRRQMSLRDNLLTQLIDTLHRGVLDLGIGVILLLAAQGIATGRFGVGDFALFVSYLLRLTQQMFAVGHILAQHRKAGVSFARLRALMVGSPAPALVAPRPASAPQPAPSAPLAQLTVRGLTYRYPDSGRGIAGIDFALSPGSFTVITGRIGAGKSTLLRVLLGLLPRDGGLIAWNGIAIEDPAHFLVPPRCAYTPQVPRLFSETLADNILQGSGEEHLAPAVHRAVLEEDIERLEAGLATPVGPRGVRLSGGQVQRSAAARMFAHDAELLVFDDLSSALDVETERLLWERLASNVTCLVVSHRRAALRRADQILLIVDGQIAERGRLDELLVRSPEMRELWGDD